MADPSSQTSARDSYRISNAVKEAVIADLRAGGTIRSVAAARGVSPSYVGKLRQNLDTALPPPRMGRPSALSTHDKRRLVLSVLSGRNDTAIQAIQEFVGAGGPQVSATTVRRTLRKAGLKARVKNKKPFLSNKHKKERLRWCMERVHWTRDQWMKVIWSDESKVNKHGPDGRSFVWLPGASPLSAREVIPTFKFGGGGVMVWGCTTAAGVCPLHFIDAILTADRYIEILHDVFLPTITAFALLPSVPAPNELIFQQDNDPKHTAKRTKDWIKAQDINNMWWPAQSPDLNPIENVWYELKTRLKSYDESARNLVILKERIAEQWTLIPADDNHRFIKSMPRRCKAVIKAGGGQTNW